MRWEEITSAQLEMSTREEVCLLPLGSLERHGPHLPLGTDGLVTYKIALMATQKEPAAVLPPLFYTYTTESKSKPGAISLEAEVFLKILENICDEVSRNGFKKIVLLNGHGGNSALLKTFLQELADKGKDYALYLPPVYLAPQVIDQLKETKDTGHACEVETSFVLYLFPELCHLDLLPDEPVVSQMDFDVVPAETSVDWYAAWPEHYVGDARKATVEKGEKMVKAQVAALAQLIRKIKHDRKVLAKVEEFGRIVREGFAS